ncbi:MAG: SagB/ThcOx family dehydrogenase [Nitrospirae bacterium]|nr:SagB/ThcOx family dehydrogenase [Nitrospirota bacterium]
MADPLDTVMAYHAASKHRFDGYAPGPRGLDWASRPDPFRRYAGAELLPLMRCPVDAPLAVGTDPAYDRVFAGPPVAPAALDGRAIGRLFYDSLALSAWKEAGPSRWALRVNPSSGNLHPTEGYLVCGPVAGLCAGGMVAHYAPEPHALEVRRRLDAATWAALAGDLEPNAVLVGLASIHWREAWKYGMRAFRYCQHDVGHAIAAVAVAAAGLGWSARILDDLGDEQVAALLGLPWPPGPAHGETEPEHPDVIVCLFPDGGPPASGSLRADGIGAVAAGPWRGTANALSPVHVPWDDMDRVAEATVKPATPVRNGLAPAPEPPWAAPASPRREAPSLRRLVRRRRSAVDMDGVTPMPAAALFATLGRLVHGGPALAAMAWPPAIHLLLFVHRVVGIAPGLYVLCRDPARGAALRAGLSHPEFAWERPPGCPDGLDLSLLMAGNATGAARALSCHQDIAAQGAFSLGMLAEFASTLQRDGAWAYRRLFWEAGAIGQLLYLEAEAWGLAGTGIGCYLDDPVHELFGITGTAWQSVYHFTVGGPVPDTRLRTTPAYPA